MDFFEHQDVARKHTGRLVFFFIMAVLGIIVLTYAAVVVILGYAQSKSTGQVELGTLFHPVLVLTVGSGVVLVIALGSLYKTSQLRAGGHVVAEMMGGQLLTRNSTDANERKLLNVVEEMALASGTPVPPVYVMQSESAINAFAAGHTPEDAVIGVTRGCMEKLNRDELQGVIAHEFSHILNGDMRLNIRLMGVIHGILLIGLLGYMVMRGSFYAGHSRSRNEKGGGAMAIMALGLALTVIGYVGTFFGNAIKAAVSRQREFLADASAVQFTRNPDGIAGALKKIGGHVAGSRLASGHAAEISHMFFSTGVSQLGSMLATHPPLAERIRRIDSSFDGKYTEVPLDVVPPIKQRADAAKQQTERAKIASVITGAVLAQESSTLSLIGQPSPEHVRYAQRLLEDLPGWAKAAAREPYSARALVYALLLDPKQPERMLQLQLLERQAEPGLMQLTEEMSAGARDLDRGMRLPLIDLANAALRELSPRQFEAFRRNVTELIQVDGRIEPLEWILHRLVVRHLEPAFGHTRSQAVQFYALTQLGGPCSTLLTALARGGHENEREIERAFAMGATLLDARALALQSAEAAGTAALDAALDQLATVAPVLKRKLLTACAAAIATDGKVTSAEAELFRAYADALGCPVPPVLPGQPLA